MCIYINWHKLLGKGLSVNFKPHYHTYTHKKSSRHTHTHRGKITVSEIQNHPNAHTHAHNDKTYQISKRGKAD